ncbi:carbohydrate ABC transporter permease [Ammoniphilus sp. 3BR4]|uniref:carbohydrate ABC transporter permease n=1 Tax=Ammoniphilus sp. 3BR4 TaxID=3158265 RepID=UPI00346590B8
MNSVDTSIPMNGREKSQVRAARRAAQWKKWSWPYFFLAPALILYAVFFIFPFFFSGFLSFSQWNLISPEMEYVGMENYRSLVADDVFWTSLKNTGIYALGTVPVTMAIGLALAILVESVGRNRVKEAYRFLLFIPVVASLAVTSMVWMLLMNPNGGLLNEFLVLFGLPSFNWLNDPKMAMWSLILVGIWKGAGYNMVLYIAGLKGIDRQLYEASAIDGAGKWIQFRSITWPLLAPMNLFVLIVSLIQSFQVFTTIHVMTHGGPNNATNVLVYQVWMEAFQFFDIGKASALSMVLFFLVLAITMFQIRMMDTKIHYQ